MSKLSSLILLVLLSTTTNASMIVLAEFGVQNLDPVLRTPLPGREFWWQLAGVTPSVWEITVWNRETLQTIITPLGSYQTTEVISQPTEFGTGWNCGNCYNHPGPGYGFTADELFVGLPFDPVYGIYGHSTVPQLGPGFTGYNVTMAELILTQNQDPFGMTVKLYGEIVPEPSTLLLFGIGIFIVFIRR